MDLLHEGKENEAEEGESSSLRIEKFISSYQDLYKSSLNKCKKMDEKPEKATKTDFVSSYWEQYKGEFCVVFVSY